MKQLSLLNVSPRSWLRMAALAGGIALLSSCEDHRVPLPGQVIQSNNPKPSWGPTITPQMLAVIEELQRLSPVPLNTLTPQEARTKPTFKDAVNSLLARNGYPIPQANVTTSERTIPGAGGVPIRVVIYTPAGVSPKAPVLVYYHGGGWVIGKPEVYEYSTQALAQNTGAVVVSVEYRKSPENKFPIAHEDAFAAYQWVRQNAASISGDANRVAVGGESAGGNMAVTVSMMARDRNVPLPVHILSVYPVANNDLTTESYNKYAMALPLNRPLVEWFVGNYFQSPADGDSPLISLVDVANLSGLPPTTIIAAEIDPLLTEGKQLADKLNSVNVPVAYQLYTGVTHEFFGMYGIIPESAQAQEFAAKRLRAAFQ